MENHSNHHNVHDIPVPVPTNFQDPFPEVKVKPEMSKNDIEVTRWRCFLYLTQIQTLKLARAMIIKRMFVIRRPFWNWSNLLNILSSPSLNRNPFWIFWWTWYSIGQCPSSTILNHKLFFSFNKLNNSYLTALKVQNQRWALLIVFLSANCKIYW